jgi:hypothetical protein
MTTESWIGAACPGLISIRYDEPAAVFPRLQGALPPPACVGITTPNFFPLKKADFAQKGGICCRFKLEWLGSNGT